MTNQLQQSQWRRCQNCEGMFFGGHSDQGVCPNGGQHDGSQSEHFIMWFGDEDFGTTLQAGWRWCRNCEGMFFGGHSDQGVCPNGGQHDGSQSAHFAIVEGEEEPDTQGWWRWCRNCEGMFFGGHSDQGVCPNGGQHDGSQSGQYVIFLES